jgi:hypothetical protein
VLSRRLFRRLWVVLAGLCAGHIIYRIVDPVMCRFPTGEPPEETRTGSVFKAP